MSQPIAKVLRFGGLTLDLARGSLSGEAGEIKLRPKSFDVLCYLAGKAGQLVSKDELVEGVWGRAVVSDESIARCISDIRAALQDGEGRIVATVPRRGYRFAAPVEGAPAEEGAASAFDGISLGVLPFLGFGDEPGREALVKGLMEDIFEALGQLQKMKLVAAHAGLAYERAGADMSRIGRELDVRHLLAGSVRWSGHKIRVSCQLFSTESGALLWSQRFENDGGDAFHLHDKVATRLAAAIWPVIIDSEVEARRRKPLGSWKSYDHYLKGVMVYRRVTAASTREALQELRRAIAIDPDFPLALAVYGIVASTLPQFGEIIEFEIATEAIRAMERALALAPHDGFVATCGAISTTILKGDRERGLVLAERATTINPGASYAWATLGWTRVFSGELKAAAADLQKALDLDPLDRVSRWMHLSGNLFIAIFEERHGERRELSRQLLAHVPDSYFGLDVALDLALLQGRPDEAEKWTKRLKAYPLTREQYRLLRGLTARQIGKLEHKAAFMAFSDRVEAHVFKENGAATSSETLAKG